MFLFDLENHICNRCYFHIYTYTMFHPSIIYNYSLTLFHLHDTGMFKSYPIKLIKTKINGVRGISNTIFYL